MDELILAVLLLLGLRSKGGGEPTDPSEPGEPEDPGVTPGIIVEPPGTGGDKPVAPVGPKFNPGTPDPTQVDDVIVDYPRPRAFYQVRAGDNFTGNQGIATRMARSALFLAAREHGGMSVPEANAWAAGKATVIARRAVTDLISCTPINDWRYGTWAYTVGVARPGPHGRAIRLLKIHFNDRARLDAGDAFSRNIRLGKPGDDPSVSQHGVEGGAQSYELLWLPGIDLRELWESDGTVWQVGGAWGDGSSHVHPPPALFARGVDDFTGGGAGPWGCAPFAVEGKG